MEASNVYFLLRNSSKSYAKLPNEAQALKIIEAPIDAREQVWEYVLLNAQEGIISLALIIVACERFSAA
jgi:hypothetical protein